MAPPKFTRTDSATSPLPNTKAASPNTPIPTTDGPWTEWGEGRRFAGREIPLSELGGAERIGVSLMELLPGKQSCPFHWHLREEEHFFVLEGRCTLRSGSTRSVVGPGDYVCFPAGSGVGHAFENPFESPCRILCIGDRNPDEIAVYPDSGKAKIRALQKIIPYPTEGLDYWHGENVDNPVPIKETKK